MILNHPGFNKQNEPLAHNCHPPPQERDVIRDSLNRSSRSVNTTAPFLWILNHDLAAAGVARCSSACQSSNLSFQGENFSALKLGETRGAMLHSLTCSSLTFLYECLLFSIAFMVTWTGAAEM